MVISIAVMDAPPEIRFTSTSEIEPLKLVVALSLKVDPVATIYKV